MFLHCSLVICSWTSYSTMLLSASQCINLVLYDISSWAYSDPQQLFENEALPGIPFGLCLQVPNTIQQDIHPNIVLAGNLPAGYSAGTILLPMIQKVRHYGQNESFDTIPYQRLSEYQISFRLFKLSEPSKFRMFSFCVSTDEKHSSKQVIFISFQKE